MKVAFVANSSWNIYNFRKGLVHYFLKNGSEILVFSPRDDYSEAIEEWGLKWIETPLEGTGGNPFKDYKYYRTLKRAFKKEKPDLILSFTIKSNIYACLASRRLNIPVICNVSGLGTVFIVGDLVGKFAVNLCRVSFKYASFIWFQNQDDKDLFLSRVSLKEHKIGLLPGSGIDLRSFTYSAPDFQSPTRFLMISRLIVEKGVREFAEAASHFVDDDRVSFTLVGRFEEQHARAISRVELDRWTSLGWLTYLPHSDEIKKVIEANEVIVLPSYREGTPRTLLEGAAMGRPLLTSNVPGCKEVVENGYNGFLFEEKSSKELISKIKLYLSLSEEEKMKLSTNSRELVRRKFDEELVISAYQEAIHRIISLA